ncbi:MAG: helix-turn-helix transcriptional regulator [Mobilibacterium timonense]|uniref:helix-turn-helix transcriptional regulator n=1 Tax=Mobilibacterium timonense TaxID=1871012 RepID=UPI002353F15F|nr:helix-turn-helix transcriptional regulator [Mobilibacterium timonense]MBM6990722.1 helix-turn-helix transcriptional regulator [Mobilibacterium timonense]
MAIGERIRWFRNRIDMTQKELGMRLGFSERTAVIRMGQYENEKRKPKQEMINELAQIFDVAPEAINVPDIDSYIGLMHTLFAIEDKYGLTITKLNGQVCLTQNVNHPSYDMHLAERLLEWCNEKSKVDTGGMRIEEYDQWRYRYPADKLFAIKESLDKRKNEIQGQMTDSKKG